MHTNPTLKPAVLSPAAAAAALPPPAAGSPPAIKGLSIKGMAKSWFQPRKALRSGRGWEAQRSKRRQELAAKRLAHTTAVPARAQGTGDPPVSPGWAGWGPPVGLRWVGSAGTGSMPHRAPGGILATGYLQPAGMRSSRCPLAPLLGDDVWGSSRLLRNNPSACDLCHISDSSSSHRSRRGGRADGAWAAPAARPVPTALPAATLHSQRSRGTLSPAPPQRGDPLAVSSPSPKASSP